MKRRPAVIATVAGVVAVSASVAVALVVRSGAADPVAAEGSKPSSASPSGTAAIGSPPAPTPTDAWRGVRPLSGTSRDAIVETLKARWNLRFDSQPRSVGSLMEGYAGDPTRKEREINVGVFSDDDGKVRTLVCGGGGENVAAESDPVLKEYLYDCVRQAFPADAWPSARAWLDKYYNTSAQPTYRGATARFTMMPTPHWITINVYGV